MNKSEDSTSLSNLQRIREEVESIVDAIGKPIDKGIFETVVYLNALGIPTTQSCEGHADSGRPWPWVRIGADNEPRERFVGQLKTYQQVADENNVQLSVVERAQNVELWAEAERRIGDVPETDEYQEWANKNSQLVNQVQVLIDEFYADRKVEDDLKLELMVMAGNEAELMPYEVNKKPVDWERLSENELAKIIRRLPARQAEMIAFTEFLRLKYEARLRKL